MSSGFFPLFQTLCHSGLLHVSQIPPPLSSFSFSFFLLPRLLPFPSLVRLLAFSPPALATYEGCSNTTCFLWCPLGALSNLSTVVFSLPPSFGLTPIYLQLDVCSPIDCFTEDMTMLCFCTVWLYIDSSVL